MFHPSYQNGGKILSTGKPPVGIMTQELIALFLKLNTEYIKKHLAQLQSIK